MIILCTVVVYHCNLCSHLDETRKLQRSTLELFHTLLSAKQCSYVRNLLWAVHLLVSQVDVDGTRIDQKRVSSNYYLVVHKPRDYLGDIAP